MDCSPPGSSIHGILQARILAWVAISISRRSSWPRDQTQVSHITGRRFNLWATREAQNTQKSYTKKDLHDSDNHEGVITHLEPDILECEVKWALGSITMITASGGDGIPVELFQILKDDAVKCCTQSASKFGKLSCGHRTGKGQFSFQFQRRAMLKNVQATTQLYSSHMLVK